MKYIGSSALLLETAATSESMRVGGGGEEASSVEWGESEEELSEACYEQMSSNVERALRRYNKDLAERGGLPALNLLTYFDEMA